MRRRGAEAAVRDAHRALQRHATALLAELVREIEESGAEAADAVNERAEASLGAVEHVTAIGSTLNVVVHLTRQMRATDISRLGRTGRLER